MFSSLKSLIVFFPLVGVLLFCFANGIEAQYRVDVWTTDDGLPQNSVNDVLQSRDGYIWVTTNDGLVRFDGVRFTIFNRFNLPELTDNRLRDLFEDASKRLWVTGEDESLGFFQNGRFSSVAKANEITFRENRRLVDDGAGGIVFSTEKNGSFEYRNGKLEPFAAVKMRQPGGEFLLRDRDGGFWIADALGLYRIKGDEIKPYDIEIQNAPEGRFYNAFEDRDGAIWFGCNHTELYRFKNGKTVKFIVPPTLFRSIAQDREGNLWIGTGTTRIDAAAVAADEADQNAVRQFPVKTSVLTGGLLCADSEGNVWIGGAGGLRRLSPQTVQVFSKKDGLPEDNIYPIQQMRDGRIRFGAWNYSLLEYGGDGAAGANFTKLPLKIPNISALYESGDGRFWIGNLTDVFYLDGGDSAAPVKFTDRLPLNEATEFHVISQDEWNNLWFGTSRGAIRYDGGEKAEIYTVQNGLPDNFVTAFLQRRDGEIWLGTRGGIASFDGEKFAPLTHADGLASNFVRALYEDADGSIWIGSYDGGLSRYKDGKFTNYTTSEGLHSNGVFVILEDDKGWFWFNSNQGIYRVRREELNDFADGKIKHSNSIAYTKADGLLNIEGNGGSQPAGIRARDGRLWFPTAEGAAVVDPNNILVNPQQPPILLEEIYIDRKPAQIADDSITIQPNQGNLEIHYTGLSFIGSSGVKFRYRLENFEDEWNEVGTRRTAYYSYLPPGEYTFHVIGANRDGVWNEQGANLKIVVLPPFYRTWWFYLLVFASVFGLMFAAFRYRVSRLEKARRLQENFSRQLMASQETERQHIAAELHDTLGQSLLIIKNRVALAQTDIDEKDTVEEQLTELSQSAAAAIEECREIAYNLRPYQISRFGLSKTLAGIFRRVEEVTPIKASVSVEDIDDVFTPEDEINIYRIVQETVNNIIKHSQATEALLAVKRTGGEVVFLIEDNGRGFARNVEKEENKNGGFGLLGIGERVKMLNGVCEIDSERTGGGTSIRIRLNRKFQNSGE